MGSGGFQNVHVKRSGPKKSTRAPKMTPKSPSKRLLAALETLWRPLDHLCGVLEAIIGVGRVPKWSPERCRKVHVKRSRPQKSATAPELTPIAPFRRPKWLGPHFLEGFRPPSRPLPLFSEVSSPSHSPNSCRRPRSRRSNPTSARGARGGPRRRPLPPKSRARSTRCQPTPRRRRRSLLLQQRRRTVCHA